jgi:hypothetical protein
MGKILSTAILAVLVVAFSNCKDDNKNKDNNNGVNLAKEISKEYSVTFDNKTYRKFKISEVNANAVKFALDSIQVDTVTSFSIAEISPVGLTKQKDSILLSIDKQFVAKVYTVTKDEAAKKKEDAKKDEKPSTKATTTTEKTVKVQVKGSVVSNKLAMTITVTDLQTNPVTLTVTGTAAASNNTSKVNTNKGKGK